MKKSLWIAALAAATVLAPQLLQTVNGSQLHSIQSLTDTIWWPATLLRIDAGRLERGPGDGCF